jgi:hypothetical protein
MAHLGLIEIIIIVLVVTIILLLFFTLKKLLRSKISETSKILWIIAFVFFQIVGMVAFIIYHDHFLSIEKRDPGQA